MCGGFDRIVQVVVAHVTERVQFGRPIGRFQAVQRLVADLAAEAALARAAEKLRDMCGFEEAEARWKVVLMKDKFSRMVLSSLEDVAYTERGVVQRQKGRAHDCGHVPCSRNDARDGFEHFWV